MQQSLATRRRRLLVRRLMVVLVVAVGAAIFASPAAAAPPTPWEYSYSGPLGVLSGCAFPVAFSTDAHWSGLDFFNANNKPTRTEAHWLEQDTYTANGHALVTAWYRYNTEITYDHSGNATYMSTGQFGRIRLPDGSLFVIAGRFKWVGAAVIVPEGLTGNPGNNLAGFCAALAP